jgi:polyferredoxin
MAKKRKTAWVVWLRRFIQSAFFVAFIYLFLETTDHPINRAGSHVTLFFDLDPLVALTSWLASHKIERAMLLSLATLTGTLLCGRWFCGWVCPFGALHNFFTYLRGGRLRPKLEAGGYSRWQTAKYYVLVAFLVAALLGTNVAGWIDPFSFFFRSLTTSIYPAINSAIVSLFTWTYNVNPGIGRVRISIVTEPIYSFLQAHFLAIKQPYYWGSLLIGVIFITVVTLNFYRARFWCRYVCPLGALLGVVGKNPLVRLQKSGGQCTNCRLCLVDCQGGAISSSVTEWKAAECFYCCNCIADCPSQAATLTVEFKSEKKEDAEVAVQVGR